MIKIDISDPTDEKWVSWRARAETKSLELREYAEKMAVSDYADHVAPLISEALYKYPKAWLMAAFNGKCAFCEARIDANQPGDVEHFRPKGAVHEDDGSAASFVTQGGAKTSHPGYFWLAYEWSNLLIACKICNSSGKRNFFPLARADARALAPSKMDAEEPLFINPREIDPAPHLRFDDTGMAIPLTPEGTKCVTLLGLNRDPLVDERKETYDNVKLKFEKYMDTKSTDPDARKLKAELGEWQLGRRKFAAQARVAIARAKTEVGDKLTLLGF